MVKVGAVYLLKVCVRAALGAGIRFANNVAGRLLPSMVVDGAVGISDDAVNRAFEWFAQRRTPIQRREDAEELANLTSQELDADFARAIEAEAPDANAEVRACAASLAMAARVNLQQRLTVQDRNGRSILKPTVRLDDSGDLVDLLRPTGPSLLAAGDRIANGRYRIERFLAQGGMGAVYLATQVRVNRQVVVKTILPAIAAQQQFRDRFFEEAQHAAKLSHPNIVAVYEADEDEARNLCFLAMQHVLGVTLDAWLSRREQGCTMVEFTKLSVALCDALEHAHARRVYHMDLKPSNIMVSEDLAQVIVLDFGLSRACGHGGPHSLLVSMIGGTPYYMAPELLQGERCDQRADVYSLGVILYELLSRNLPVGRYRPLIRRRGDVPIGVSETIDRALESDPNERIRSVSELRAALADATRMVVTLGETAPPARQGPGSASEWVSSGDAKLMKRDYDGCIRDCSEAIRLDAKTAQAWYCRGDAKRMKGEYDGCVSDCSEAIRLNPKYVHAWSSRGEAKRMKGDYDGCISDCLEAIRLDPKHVRAWSNLAASKIGKGDYDGCISDCSEAIRLDAKYVHAWYCRGDAKRMKGEYDGCVGDCSEAIRLDAKYVHAWSSRGEAKRMKGDYDGCTSDCSEAIRLDPKHVRAWSNLAASKIGKGDYDGCVSDCSEAIRLDAKYVHAWYCRGDAKRMKGEYDGCIRDCSEAIRLNPKYVHAWYSRGDAKRMKGEYDGCISDCSEAIRLNPKYVHAWYCRGDAKRMKGDSDDCISDCSEAIRLDPKQVQAWSSLAASKLVKGDYDGCISDCSEAIRLDAKYVHAWYCRGDAKRMKGEYDGCVSDCSEAIRLNPKYVHAWSSRGDAKRMKGDYDGCISDCSEAIRLDPKHVRAWSSRGEAKRMKGDQSSSHADTSEALRLDPKDALALESRRRLQSQRRSGEASI